MLVHVVKPAIRPELLPNPKYKYVTEASNKSNSLLTAENIVHQPLAVTHRHCQTEPESTCLSICSQTKVRFKPLVF